MNVIIYKAGGLRKKCRFSDIQFAIVEASKKALWTCRDSVISIDAFNIFEIIRHDIIRGDPYGQNFISKSR